MKKIFKQILLALCFLHDKKIAHLNISEKSIMLVHKNPSSDKSVIAKLVGFGLAHENIEFLEPISQ